MLHIECKFLLGERVAVEDLEKPKHEISHTEVAQSIAVHDSEEALANHTGQFSVLF